MDDEILDLIYETILLPNAWNAVAEKMTKTLATTNTVISVEESNLDLPHFLRIQNGLPSEFAELYSEQFRSEDVWRKTLYHAPQGKFWSDELLCLRSQYEKSRICNELHKDHDIYHGIGCWVASFDSVNLAISLLRNKSQGRFTEEENAYLNSLVSHFNRAAKLGYRNLQSNIRSDMLKCALGNEQFAVLINTDFKLIEATADIGLIDGTLLEVKNDILTICDQSVVAIIKDYVTTLNETNFSLREELKLNIGELYSSKSYAVTLTPIMIPNDIFGAYKKLAVVINFKPNAQLTKRSSDIIRATLAITETELITCTYLAQGKNAKQIALQRNKSEHTVRTQIKNIQSKLGASSKNQIVSIFLAEVHKH